MSNEESDVTSNSESMKGKAKRAASNFGSAFLMLVIGCSVLTVAAYMLQGTLVHDWSGEAIAIKAALLAVAVAFVIVPLYMIMSPPVKTRHYARSSAASVRRLRKMNMKTLKSGIGSVLATASGFDKVYDE